MRKQLLEQAMNRGQRSVEACTCKLFHFYVLVSVCDCVFVGMLNMVEPLSIYPRHRERRRKREGEKEEREAYHHKPKNRTQEYYS